MRIDPREPSASIAELVHGQIHAGTLDAFRIVDQENTRLCRSNASDDVLRAIRAATVGNHDHQIQLPRVFQETRKQLADMRALVQARNDGEHFFAREKCRSACTVFRAIQI